MNKCLKVGTMAIVLTDISDPNYNYHGFSKGQIITFIGYDEDGGMMWEDDNDTWWLNSSEVEVFE